MLSTLWKMTGYQSMETICDFLLLDIAEAIKFNNSSITSD